MAQSPRRAGPFGGLSWQAARTLLLASILAFAAYTAWGAFVSAFDNEDFPESLAVKVELLPVIFPLHMVTGALALVLLPLALALRHRPGLHRVVGRIAAADVLLSGLTAFPVAWVVPVTEVSAAGFSMQAAVWLVLLGLGVHFIRQGRREAHWTCMVLMVATTSGAIVFRVFLALWALFGSMRRFEAFYALDAWIAWMLPLGITAMVLFAQRKRATLRGRPFL